MPAPDSFTEMHDSRPTAVDWVNDLGHLLDALRDSDIEELEVEVEGARLVIRRDPVPAGTTDGAGGIEGPPSGPWVVTAPVVGVFRRLGDGSSGTALAEGDPVAAGQVVGLVEAMRMTSQVQSDRAGVIAEYLVRNGQPVEYGQPLLRLRAP